LFSIANTLRAGRYDDRVPVGASISIFIQSVITASGAQTKYCTRGAEPLHELGERGLKFNISLPHILEKSLHGATPLSHEATKHLMVKDVNEVLHYVITKVEVQILLTTC
jgi:hypothetical protein